MKKLLAIILVAVMALSVLPFAASADETWAWEIKDDVLTITGTGVVGANNSAPEDYPWNDDRATITEVVVGDGITEIGKNAFCHLDSVTKVTFGKDVTVLNMDAMAYCGALTDIVFGGPITTVGQGTIFGSGSIANVTITGQTKDQFLAVATVQPYNTGFEKANIIVNGAPALVWPNAMTITPKFGEVENWSGATFFIAGFAATNESNATIVSKLKDGTYAMKVVLIDETAEETHTIPKYFFDHTAGGSKEFYSDNSFMRIAFCDYGIVPVVDHAYTLQFVITEGGEVRYNATSETGAFDSFNDAFKADGAIIPEEIPHPNGGAEPEGPVAIKIFPQFGKWENWINSPNNPNNVPGATDEEKQPGVTQLLVGISDANDAKIDIDAALTWKVTISAGDESKTITMAPATKDLDYNLYRFETCLGEGENQFVPVNGTDYTVQITVYGEDGAELYKSEAVSGFTCPMDPVVPETPVDPQPPVVEPPVAGDATVMIAVLAVVALFGAAVVTKKVFVK